MPETFTYKARDKSGNLVNGTLQADSEGLVLQRLREMGYTPLEASKKSTKSRTRRSSSGSGAVGPRVDRGDPAEQRQGADRLPAFRSQDQSGNQPLKRKSGSDPDTDHFPTRLSYFPTRIASCQVARCYLVIAPQAMRSPALPDGSVFMSSAAA